MKATSVERAEVFCDEVKAGRLERTAHGSRFTYEPRFLEACEARGWGLGFCVPRAPVVETHGVNLHTFFAGLLPEGVRLQALERAVKTSRDDLMSLLLAAGSEAVGDVRVVAAGARRTRPPVLDLARLGEASFADVLRRSLDYARGAEQRLIPGVQPKVSAAMVTLPVRVRAARAAEAMLKLEPPEFPRLVANEHFFMKMAAACGLDVAEVSMVHDAEGAPGLVVSRFDRPGTGRRLHCEDACQFLDRYPADKYRIALRDVLEGVRRYSTSPALEVPKVLRLLTFSYLIANGDLHARNVSLLVSAGGRVEVAPAYDLLATLPYGDRRLALKVLGRDDNLKRAHVKDLGRLVGVAPRVVDQLADEVCEGALPWLGRLGEIGLPMKKTAHLERVTRKRRDDLR